MLCWCQGRSVWLLQSNLSVILLMTLMNSDSVWYLFASYLLFVRIVLERTLHLVEDELLVEPECFQKAILLCILLEPYYFTYVVRPNQWTFKQLYLRCKHFINWFACNNLRSKVSTRVRTLCETGSRVGILSQKQNPSQLLTTVNARPRSAWCMSSGSKKCVASEPCTKTTETKLSLAAWILNWQISVTADLHIH